MKKSTIWILAGILVLAAGVGAAVYYKGNKEDKAEAGEQKEQESKTKDSEYESEETEGIKAVYLTDEAGNHLFVDVENETPFFGTIPEGQVYDEENEKISGEDLGNGDVVCIWGNGAMAQSYPAQYPGISKIQIEERENQEYTEKYQTYMEQFFPKPDLTQVPYLDISYTQSNAIVTAAVDTLGYYQWTYEDEESGGTVTKEMPKESVLKRDDLTEIRLSGSREGELLFSVKPGKAEAVRWQSDEKTYDDSQEEEPEGQAVELSVNQEGNYVIAWEKGYIYLIRAEWEQGQAEYGFYTAE